MNTQFEIASSTTVEWYTPPEIIRALGVFDLDPCTSEVAWQLNRSAAKYYTLQDDGLSKEWAGRVWLNPPYSQPALGQFIERMAVHNNGIALLYNRCDSKLFQQTVLPVADSVMFLAKRIRFYRPDGSIGGSPGSGSLLISFGQENTKAVIGSGLKGCLMKKCDK